MAVQDKLVTNAGLRAAYDDLNVKYTEVKADLGAVVDDTLSIKGKGADSFVAGQYARLSLESIENTEKLVNSSKKFVDYMISAANRADLEHKGITYTWDATNMRFSISGTATGNSYRNLIGSTSSWSSRFTRGKTYYAELECDNPNVKLNITYHNNQGGDNHSTYYINRFYFTVLDSSITTYNGMMCRLAIKEGATVNNVTATFKVYEVPFNELLFPTGINQNDDILLRLNTFGICRLTKGEFIVSDLVMPENTSIIGIGEQSVIKLDNSGTFAIKPKSYCVIDRLKLEGGYNEEYANLPSTIGSKCGISFTLDGSDVPRKVILSNLYINGFNGSGLYQNDTGTNIDACLHANNIIIENCVAGININRSSEFNHYNMIKVFHCYYAVINNGGNNYFANCSFSRCVKGMIIQGSNTNSAHGSCVCCDFNHIGVGSQDYNNALELYDISAGYIFSQCQFYYSAIVVSACNGVIISDSNFGSNNPIAITNGKLFLMHDCVSTGSPTITITGNDKTHFNNCYNKNGNAWSA